MYVFRVVRRQEKKMCTLEGLQTHMSLFLTFPSDQEEMNKIVIVFLLG